MFIGLVEARKDNRVFSCSAGAAVSSPGLSIDTATRAAKVKHGRQATGVSRRSVLDGGEHGASLDQTGLVQPPASMSLGTVAVAASRVKPSRISLCAISPRHTFTARWMVRRCLSVNLAGVALIRRSSTACADRPGSTSNQARTCPSCSATIQMGWSVGQDGVCDRAWWDDCRG